MQFIVLILLPCNLICYFKKTRKIDTLSVILQNDFAVSPLADIFVGYVRSAVFKTTSKDSATVEPFFTLKLDIQVGACVSYDT